MAVDVVTQAEADYQAWQASKKAATERATTQSGTGIDGNSVTNAISNDQLTNDDFLRLMLEEMKMQDPTKPMDSAALMDNQLKMSQIQSSADMASAMKALQASYANSALSTASNMIGKNVKDGSTDDKGDPKVFGVESVENRNGTLFLNVKQATEIKDVLQNTETEKVVKYDDNGYIYEDDVKTNIRVSLDGDKRFETNSDGSLKLLDEDNQLITDESIKDKYTMAGSVQLYSEGLVQLELNKVTEVR